MFKFEIFLLLFSTSLQFIMTAVIIDCQSPPQLVDPAKCCLDGGRDEVTEMCAQRLGITGQPSDTAPTVETATCLAECILTELNYIEEPQSLALGIIKSNLYTKFPNDTIYADAMVEAFAKCEPSAQRKMQAFKEVPLGNMALQTVCNPFAGIVLGCTYMEYFKNCPAHRWTESTECNMAKQFVTQCSVGA